MLASLAIKVRTKRGKKGGGESLPDQFYAPRENVTFLLTSRVAFPNNH